VCLSILQDDNIISSCLDKWKSCGGGGRGGVEILKRSDFEHSSGGVHFFGLFCAGSNAVRLKVCQLSKMESFFILVDCLMYLTKTTAYSRSNALNQFPPPRSRRHIPTRRHCHRHVPTRHCHRHFPTRHSDRRLRPNSNDVEKTELVRLISWTKLGTTVQCMFTVTSVNGRPTIH